MGPGSWRYELICIICLGVGTMCLMNGYDTQSFLVESVLHSVHTREPTRMEKHAGYYGQAVLYGAYTSATLIAPLICFRIGSKWSLFVGSLLFTVYQAGFFVLNSYYYYLSQALMGIGFALYYSGQGLYMSEHSTRATIPRNSSLVSGIGQSSMLLGGIVLTVIFYIRQRSSTVSDSVLGEETGGYRNFSNNEIYVIYGVLLVFTVISNVIFAVMPSQVESDSKLNAIDKPTIRTQLGQLLDTAREPRMILLSFFFIFYGLHVSFWLGAYPTTFAFTKVLSGNVFLPAYFSTMVGIGNIVVGCYITVFVKWYPNFGLVPTMATQVVLSGAMYFVTIVSTPNFSTIERNDEATMWITPSTLVCCILGILHGMIDCCSCSMRALICTIAVPRRKLQAYSLAKLYQSAASCTAYFFSPYLTVYAWMTLLACAQLLSTVSFVIVSRQVTNEELQQNNCLKTSKIHPADANYSTDACRL